VYRRCCCCYCLPGSTCRLCSVERGNVLIKMYSTSTFILILYSILWPIKRLLCKKTMYDFNSSNRVKEVIKKEYKKLGPIRLSCWLQKLRSRYHPQVWWGDGGNILRSTCIPVVSEGAKIYERMGKCVLYWWDQPKVTYAEVLGCLSVSF